MTLNKHFHLLEDLQKWLFFSFAFLLPISQKISTLNIVLLVLISIVNFKKGKFNINKEFIALISLYFIYCLSLLYSSEMQLGVVEQKASLLFFPLIFILNKNITKEYNIILKYFVFGCVLALIICELNAVYNSLNFERFSFDSKIDKSSTFYNSMSSEKNHFFSYNFSVLHQTVYFSIYLLFAISVLLKKVKIIKSQKVRLFFILILLVGVFQTLNKAGLVVLITIIVSYLFTTIRNGKTAIIVAVLCSILGFLLFTLNPRFERFKKSFSERNTPIKYEDFRKIDNKNPNYQNFRYMLWSSSTQIIQQNPIIGIGAGGSHNRLYEVFAVKRQWYDKNEKYHCHNQYLQILLDLGILGFLPFLFILNSFRGFSSEYMDIGVMFVLIIAVNFLFESMFERYSGISFFSFFYCLFISFKKNKDKIVC